MDEVYELYDTVSRKRAVELIWLNANDALNFLEKHYGPTARYYRVQGITVAQ